MTLSKTSLRAFGGSCFQPLRMMSSSVLSSRIGTYLLIAMLSSVLLIRSNLCKPNFLTATDASAGPQTARERAHESCPDVAEGNFLYR